MPTRSLNDPEISALENDDWQRYVELLRQPFAEDLQCPNQQLFLKPDERTALATRVRIIEEFMKGEISQRELKSQLGAGIAPSTRGSNRLTTAPADLKQWLEEQLLADK